MDILGTVKRFAGDRVAELRDSVAVPILDRAMEAGVVPADVGMVSRWASGTTQPLTRTPKNTRQDISNAVTASQKKGRPVVDGYQTVNSYEDLPKGNSIENSLGQFQANPDTGAVRDRYDFNYYQPNNKDTDFIQEQGLSGGIEMLRAGEPRGIIPITDALGLTKPGHGYDVRFNYKK